MSSDYIMMKKINTNVSIRFAIVKLFLKKVFIGKRNKEIQIETLKLKQIFVTWLSFQRDRKKMVKRERKSRIGMGGWG